MLKHKPRMKMEVINHSLFLVLLCLFSFVGCGENTEIDNNGYGSIYGIVTDYATGEPVPNANIQLRPTGETALTGYDGTYEILDLQDGGYSLTVSKAEYTDLIDDYVIQIKNGRRMRRDVQIEKIPTYIRLTDMMGNDITQLDYGIDASVIVKSFNVYNNGTVKIDCEVVKSCEWITTVSPSLFSLSPGQNSMITVQIDRSKLAAGYNSTYLYVTSNNGNNILEITAIGQEIPPSVITLPVTYIDGTITPWCNTFHAEVTAIGNPAYHKRGFCYSSNNNNPTISDNLINVSGSGLGEYSYTYWEFPPKTITYYVRAWLMYDTDEKIIYGNVQTFTYNDF